MYASRVKFKEITATIISIKGELASQKPIPWIPIFMKAIRWDVESTQDEGGYTMHQRDDAVKSNDLLFIRNWHVWTKYSDEVRH